MIRQILGSFQRRTGTIRRLARLECLALEPRLTPAGADGFALMIAAPEVVTLGPPSKPVDAPPPIVANGSGVRSDLFGHGVPDESETNDLWNECGSEDVDTVEAAESE